MPPAVQRKARLQSVAHPNFIACGAAAASPRSAVPPIGGHTFGLLALMATNIFFYRPQLASPTSYGHYSTMVATVARVIGRQRERAILDDALRPERAALVAIYGRRRVGKTHLVRAHLRPKADTYFEVIGQHAASKATQLEHFQDQLETTFFSHRLPRLKDWRQALALLGDGIENAARQKPRKPVVVFFDELPWLATHRSGLLPAIDHLWNARLSSLPNLTWVLCGSAASFMLDRLIHAKGGLHNRITHRLRLEPFRLGEAHDLLMSRGLRRGTSQVVALYMAFGGVPHYLLHVPRGSSASQAIGRLCFDRSGPLSDEFNRLLSSLFDDSREHERIIRATARRRRGVSRDELIQLTRLPSGGRLTRRLDELEAAGFLARFVPYQRKSRDVQYRLIDEYSKFHLTWVETAPKSTFGSSGVKYWLAKSQSPAYRAWAGFTFEGMCLKHASEIERALGIEGMANEVGIWHLTPRPGRRETGAQVDLLFDRPDGVINLCEIKHSDDEYVLTKSYAKQLVEKAEIFRKQTRTRKQIAITLITTHGLKPGLWNDEVIDSVVTADDLFEN